MKKEFKYQPKLSDFDEIVLTRDEIARLMGLNRWQLHTRCRTQFTPQERRQLKAGLDNFAREVRTFAKRLVK